MSIVIVGGHHNSALPVIDELKKRDKNIEIHWIGHKYSMVGDKSPTLEYEEISKLEIPFYDLKAGKAYRTKSILRIIKIPFGFVQALYFLLKIRPNVIMSFGGYLAAPVVFSGWFLGIPSLTHEQTVVAGYANKFISHFVRKVLVTWEKSAGHFSNKKVVFTGLPIRKEIFSCNSDNFEQNKDLPTVYVTAGKTGSHKINMAILGCMEKLLEICNIIHQCGSNSAYNDFDALTVRHIEIENSVEGKYNVRKHVLSDEIGEAFSKADLVVSRAGAHTIAELICLEKPAIVVPIPWSSHNEQYENGKILKNSGLGEIFDEKDLSPDNIYNCIKDRINRLGGIKLKKEKYKSTLMTDSAKLIVDEIYAVLK